jgi:hypothetical protein
MIGRLRSWSNRGFGIVAVAVNEIYFLHASAIVEFPAGMIDPPLNSIVHFDVAPPVNGGKHHRAVNARINPAVEGVR